MADYMKMKNDELQTLLKSRNLPHTGKKADMVARLQDADKSGGGATSVTTDAPAAIPAQLQGANSTAKKDEDEIDWDDDPIVPTPTAESAPTLANTKAGNDAKAVGNHNISAVSTTGTAAAPAPQKDTVDFSSGLGATDIDAEIARRQKRAAKFGLTAEDSDTIRALQRAKRFGTGPAAAHSSAEEDVKTVSTNKDGPDSGVSRLDTALPERSRGRGVKRSRDEGPSTDTFDDPGLRKRRGGGFRGRSRGRPRAEGGRDTGRGGGRLWMSEDDKKRAEARKARFG